MRAWRPVQTNRCRRRPGLSSGTCPDRNPAANTRRSADRLSASAAPGPSSRASATASALSAEGPIRKLLATIPSALFTTRTRKAFRTSPAAVSAESTCAESSRCAPRTSSSPAGKPESSAIRSLLGSSTPTSPSTPSALANTASTPPAASAMVMRQSSSPSHARRPTTPFSKRAESARKFAPCCKHRMDHLTEPANAHHQTMAWSTGAPPAAS
mmetsp:Transcript_10251/g.30850  ORF Transcript_10251/g.30850 Transcript_10251/m.30850 type:complete len:213 (+) Transcript_10251:127-765(+)